MIRRGRRQGTQAAHISDIATADAVRRLDARIDERAVRVGTVSFWSGNIADLGPDDLALTGQRLRIADYPELFRIIGTRYGGDGITSFDLPDMRSSSGTSGPGGLVEAPWQTYAVQLQNKAGTECLHNALGAPPYATLEGKYKHVGNTVEARIILERDGVRDGDIGPSTFPPWFYFTLPMDCTDDDITGAAYYASKGYSSADGFDSGLIVGGENLPGVCRCASAFRAGSGPSRMMAFFALDNGSGFQAGALQAIFPYPDPPGEIHQHITMTIVYPANEDGTGGTNGIIQDQLPLIVRAR